MNKPILILFLSITTNVFLHSPVKAQLCGRGTFTFKIYALSGKKLEDINYEILPVNIDSLRNVYRQSDFDLYRGEIINPIYLKKVNSSEEKELMRQLAFRDNKKKGVVKEGIVTFKTIETDNYPCILHLFSNKKDLYVVAYLIGSCNRVTAVLWDKYPQLVTTYRE